MDFVHYVHDNINADWCLSISCYTLLYSSSIIQANRINNRLYNFKKVGQFLG